MCLSIKGSRIPKIATRDIVVYKVFNQEFGFLISPFRLYNYGQYFPNKTIKASGMTIWDIRAIIRHNKVCGGFIHCYKSWAPRRKRCVIPKGTLYYESDYEMCARKLRVL